MKRICLALVSVWSVLVTIQAMALDPGETGGTFLKMAVGAAPVGMACSPERTRFTRFCFAAGKVCKSAGPMTGEPLASIGGTKGAEAASLALFLQTPITLST